MIREIEDILKNIKHGDRICIIHHNDADGCSSAAMFYILVDKLTGSYPYLFPLKGPDSVNRKLINSLKGISPDFIFALDLSIEPKRFNIFDGFVIDHHVFDVEENERRLKYFNPRLFEKDDEKVVPTSFIAYKILKDLIPEENVSWIAGVGITEDHRVELCKEVFEDVRTLHQDLLKDQEITQDSIENSSFGIMWDVIKSGRMVRGTEGARTAVLALVECKDRPDRFLNGLSEHSFILKRFHERVLFETQQLLRDVERNAKFYRDKKVVVYEPKATGLDAITSFLADKIRQKYPEWIVCVMNKTLRGMNVKISIRLEQKERSVDLVAILNEIKKKILSLRGGGHKSAVGVNLSLNDLNRFFEEFLGAI
jgi:single-stranded DNA-specific DHH superfamily exonuclease